MKKNKREREKKNQYLENNIADLENKELGSFMFSFGNACYCKAYVCRD